MQKPCDSKMQYVYQETSLLERNYIIMDYFRALINLENLKREKGELYNLDVIEYLSNQVDELSADIYFDLEQLECEEVL